MDVKITRLNEQALIPTKGTEQAACFDLYSAENVEIRPGETQVVSTGIGLELPVGSQAKVLGRSGMSKSGVFVLTGTIDSDYRGDIGVIMYNSTKLVKSIRKADRIAQLDIMAIPEITLVPTESAEMTTTKRGSKGFGSTGA